MSTAETLPVASGETAFTRTAPIPEELLVKVLEPYSYKGCTRAL